MSVHCWPSNSVIPRVDEMQTHSPGFYTPTWQCTEHHCRSTGCCTPAACWRAPEKGSFCSLSGDCDMGEDGCQTTYEFTHTNQMPKPVGIGPAKQDVNITKHRPASETSAPVTTQRQTQQPALRAPTHNTKGSNES